MGELATNDRVQLTCRDSGGDGVPLVMLHGWGRTQAMYRHRTDGLAPARRVIAPDTIFDVAGLLELDAAPAGPDGAQVRDDFVRGMFSGDPDRDLIAFVADRIPGARLHAFPAGVANSRLPFLENPPVLNAVVDTSLSEAANAAPCAATP
ncbi:alpha/beta fold hydrolase [Streptomyces gelaticus]|uniref:alpha/beta fold hydrolase n=1 Tax=Streptomyces gelaticus TaxID=285446 RepID=UPI0037A52E27